MVLNAVICQPKRENENNLKIIIPPSKNRTRNCSVFRQTTTKI